MLEIENPIVQNLSIIGLAIIVLIIGAQKIIRDWRTTKAESDIISLMHEEIERMSAQNTTLSIELGKLQTEIIQLNQQLSKLNIENHKLREEISALTSELNSFKKLAALRKVKV